MLTFPEKIIFSLIGFAVLITTILAIRRLLHVIGAGKGKPNWRLAWHRLANVFIRLAIFRPVFHFRIWPSLFHALVGWGFVFYLLVNIFDLVNAFTADLTLPGVMYDGYRLLKDILSVAVLVGMVFFIIRRFVIKPKNLSARENIHLHSKARSGISRDSAIVASFICLHVGSLFLGDSFDIVLHGGNYDQVQPFASIIASFWSGMSPATLSVCEKITFWLAFGSIFLFIPYFPYSKHIHIIFAPLNHLLKPPRRSMGEMSLINSPHYSERSYGTTKIVDLGWEQIMDAYACSMCFRCQEVCPAYRTQKILSPAALEINKRYIYNSIGDNKKLPLPSDKLSEIVIPPGAIWACKTCGACEDICPVKDEPMRDILEIRRSLMMENNFPKQLDTAFLNMKEDDNPWGVPSSERMDWAEGLSVPIIDENPQFGTLWWVGCAPSTETKAQKTAQAFAKILNAAKVNYAVLGKNEQCTGDFARRVGHEKIFKDLALVNVAKLNDIKPRQIVTTCPHCLNTLKNEYPAFGGFYNVIHHTQFIIDLIKTGKLQLKKEKVQEVTTFHDPCYLGRINGVVDAPRQVLKRTVSNLIEMPFHGKKSFCCGAGGGHMFMEQEERGTTRISATRLAESKATKATILAVACPFCRKILDDEANTQREKMTVLDIAEIVASMMA